MDGTRSANDRSFQQGPYRHPRVVHKHKAKEDFHSENAHVAQPPLDYSVAGSVRETRYFRASSVGCGHGADLMSQA
jgi:hypothetical protein